MPLLRICLLGGFQVSARGEPLVAVNASHLQALIAYLALHRGAPQTRQHLAFLLWPDSAEEQARTNLRKLLLRLRQVWPPIDEFVNMEGQTLQLRMKAPLSLDVAEFEDAVATGDLERAASLYSGHLLPDCYDEWIVPERERLSQLFVGAVEKLISDLESRREYRIAITQAQRLLQHDPLNEATHRTLMRLHALNSDRAGALRAYQACQHALRRANSMNAFRKARHSLSPRVQQLNLSHWSVAWRNGNNC
jgi:DNA-binding SARP family transcriptional activator